MNPCQERNSYLYQSFIHMMNDFQVRNEILSYHRKRTAKQDKYKWAGTWVVREKNKMLTFEDLDPCLFKKGTTPGFTVERFLQTRKRMFQKSSVFVMFTVCILYETNLVHYVSFVYDTKERSLLSFDPGVELYLHGQKTIVPLIQRAFEKSGLLRDSNHSILGACHSFGFRNKKPGVQYNGNDHHSLPADAFCQSWTIFFLVRLIHCEETDPRVFLERWCNIHPRDREAFITSFFILPTLVYFPLAAKKHRDMVGVDGAVDLIMSPVEGCFFRHKLRVSKK